MYFIGATCFDERFLLSVITGIHCFLKILSLLWGFFHHHVFSFLQASKSFICYLLYNFTILMLTFQNKPDLKLILIFENCFRSSDRSCSLKKDVHNFFSKFTRKHLCRVSFLIKLQKALAIKKETLAQVLFCEFCEISKNTFFKDHLRTTTSRVSCSFILWLDLFFICN